ncbi:hypothetical protein FIBSPDRAFT_1054733 [Athelia psychrophila]|uniref:Uncharacterized protein n=1 Tax=Athelia psychrophila TaxID=1759441 RepID=A0A167UVU8_9AGAM|nr:hypothetical protein FIBSPDRAFT_1054733 [Fibularhizoctonia sp. CBS 109695]
MAPNVLPIRILFHAIFAFVYVPTIVLGFNIDHMDGFLALAPLIGLGIMAALDIVTIYRQVNQRAFLIIEIIVVVLMPLSVYPIVVSCIYIVWTASFFNMIHSCYDVQGVELWPKVHPPWCNLISFIATPDPEDEVKSASLIAATVAFLGLNAAFVSYICITAIMDKARGNKFLPTYPGESSLSSTGPHKRWRLFGMQRTPAERAVVVRHCADYIFRHSFFRKHAFEPTVWAIFRGIFAVYSCIGLLVFSAYSSYIEYQFYLHRAYVVNDAILSSTNCSMVAADYYITSVTATIMADDTPTFPTTLAVVSPGTYYTKKGSGTWYHEFDTTYPPAGFEISWNANDSVLVWVTMANTVGFMNSTQAILTSPLILAPFKQYTISLSMMRYIIGNFWFLSYRPDFIASVDSASGSNVSVATFSFNTFCQAIIQRQLSPPSLFAEAARVLSTVGGTMASIDGIFALLFGRTIAAILFGQSHFPAFPHKFAIPRSAYAHRAPGTRIVSPFGLLGVVTHNRFKRLIHQQYPHMQGDIDRGGMAAYISEVAIDAALIDSPPAPRSTTPIASSRIGDVEEGGDNNELRADWQERELPPIIVRW